MSSRARPAVTRVGAPSIFWPAQEVLATAVDAEADGDRVGIHRRRLGRVCSFTANDALRRHVRS